MNLPINQIIQGDCLEITKELPDGCVDLIIADPPYGDNTAYGRNEKEIDNNEDETINYKMLDGAYKILKNDSNLYLFTNWKFETKLRNYIEQNTQFAIRMMLVVVKNNFGMGYGFRNQYELCLVLEKGSPKYNLNDFSNVIRMEHIQHDKDTHPHQKGLDMIKKIILHSSKENDIILDPFLGSGTTTEACKQLKRNFIGIEISGKYCEMARQRLRQEVLI